MAVVVGVSGCGSFDNVRNKVEGVQTTKIIVDSIGRSVEIPYPVTSAAVSNNYTMESIAAIGAAEAVKAIDFDMYRNRDSWPQCSYTEEQVFAKNQMNINYEHTAKINPQVVIIPDNADWQMAEKKLAPFGIKVIVVNPYYGDTFTSDIRILGEIFGKEERAEKVAKYFEDQISYIERQLKNVKKKSIYVEYNPTEETTIPGDYFYGIVKYSGGKNIFDDAKAIKINLEEVVKRNPEYIVIVGNKELRRNIIPPTAAQYAALKKSIQERTGWSDIEAVKKDRILLLSMTGHEGAGKLIGAFYTAKFLYPKELPDLHPEQIFKQWIDWQGSLYYPGHTYPAFELTD